MFAKFQTHNLEVLSPNYEKAHLLSIGYITAKFEEATPCSYRDMLPTLAAAGCVLKKIICTI